MSDQARTPLEALRQARDDYETSLLSKDGSSSQTQYLEKARRGIDRCEDLIKELLNQKEQK